LILIKFYISHHIYFNMPSDSDPVISHRSQPDTIMAVIVNIFGGIRYKFIFILFATFLILQSDVFIERVLSKIDSATYGSTATSYGTMIQGLLLCLVVILLDGVINQKIL
jgi:hypothetical protein